MDACVILWGAIQQIYSFKLFKTVSYNLSCTIHLLRKCLLQRKHKGKHNTSFGWKDHKIRNVNIQFSENIMSNS